MYGCAIVAKFDAAWAATYRDPILSLLRDYANPSTDDPYFTQLRQFDIFDSHSWAAGLFVFADGRNQVGSTNIGCTQEAAYRCRRSQSVHELTIHTGLDCLFFHLPLYVILQESSSESINSYYAMGLLGQSLQDPAMESLGRALMTLEIQGTKSYWHSTKADTVYPEVYAENKWFVHVRVRVWGAG